MLRLLEASRIDDLVVIDDARTEFPRHRGSLTAKPYRYGYCASPSLEPTWPTLKFDLKTGEQKSLQTDRVVLRPGPPEEVEVVHQMYRWFVEDARSRIRRAA